jgi:ribosome-binding factor A
VKRKSGRPQKVGDQIQRELSELIQREVRDPRVGMVTLTGVDMSPDCTHAIIHYTCLDPTRVESAGKGLDAATGFLRSQLAKRVKIYSTPELRFIYDESVERGARLSQLIDSVTRDLDDPAAEGDPGDSSAKGS